MKDAVHLALSLGSFIALDKLLKKGFLAAAIRFPSALFGMFSIFSLLLLLDVTKPEAASAVVNFFAPATVFIQRWLPLFYVPSLVVLPLAVKGIPTASAAKIGAILVGGWAASLAVAGYTALFVRKLVKTQMMPAEPMPKPAAFSNSEIWGWTVVLVASFALAIVSPTFLGSVPSTVLLFFLSATVLGYMVGSSLPPAIKKVFHPIIACAVSAGIAAFAYGSFSGFGFDAALGAYLTKNGAIPGAGDVLMGFLGSVILSFAFSMYKQRKLIQRHAAEIFSSVIVSSVFSLYSTAAVGHLVGLDPSLTIAIVPRCITVALALSIANIFEITNTSVTAAVVVLTGLVGANFAQTVMDRLGWDDPIARGMATASSAHGLGTAALSAKEPEALPFCAIAYALTGIFCSLLCCVPAVKYSLFAISGL
ncbi:hypothetical protein KP509_02G093900 [Ceratopteris richardii]|nr:hypothetical protein KP509_02G093900 [Ceratopteris richardii]